MVSTGTAFGTSLTAPTGTVVGTSDTQTLTNKTVDGVSPTTFGYVDATSSIQTQLNAKAPIASPTFTGTPAVPTATGGTNTTQIASTAYVVAALASYAPTASPTFTGTVTLPVTGSTQCLHVNSSGNISGTGQDCGAGSSGISGGTNGYFSLFGSATTITSAAPMDYGITTASVITATVKIVSTEFDTNGAGAGGFGAYNSAGTYYTIWGSAASGANNTVNGPATIPSNGDVIYASVSGAVMTIADAGFTYSSVVKTIQGGSQALSTSQIAANSCNTTAQAATGITTSDVIITNVNGDPTSTTGFTPASSGSLYIWVYPTSGNINWKVCNPTTNPITPGPITMNWKVAR
jgi:hypothetical protein